MLSMLGGHSNPAVSRRNPKDEYELLNRIGSGTYGEVYKARAVATNDFAAVKIIKLEPGDDFGIIQQEIIMMSECHHPNIVAYFGSYLRKDLLWIVMEYCGGGSMQDIYHAVPSLNEPTIAFVVRETLRGLDYLHRRGKMHRDIKGANILLTDDGNVKLADFGVAAQITATINKRKSFIGTPYWMAPEVAAVERKGGYDQLCDIWAVGITAIEFAEKEPPMFDLHPMRFLFLIGKSNFKPPTFKDPRRWSSSFQAFVKLALTKNPKRRPAASQLLTHQFVSAAELGPLLTRQMLEQMRNPSAQPSRTISDTDDDDDEGPIQRPTRIPSKKTPPRARSSSAENLAASQAIASRVTPLVPGSRDAELAAEHDDSLTSYSRPTDRAIGSSSQEGASKLSPEFERMGLGYSFGAAAASTASAQANANAPTGAAPGIVAAAGTGASWTSSTNASLPLDYSSPNNGLVRPRGSSGGNASEALSPPDSRLLPGTAASASSYAGAGASTYAYGANENHLGDGPHYANVSVNVNAGALKRSYEAPEYANVNVRGGAVSGDIPLRSALSSSAGAGAARYSMDLERATERKPSGGSASAVLANSPSSASSQALLERSRAVAQSPPTSTSATAPLGSMTAAPGAAASEAQLAGASRKTSATEKTPDNVRQALAKQKGAPPLGLPPTPKVPMGACLSKVFEGCPLKVNAVASWVRPEDKEHIVIFGTNEGIYTLNLNQLHENSLELLHGRRCTWLYVVKNVLFSVGGNHLQLYRHELPALFALKQARASLPFGFDQSRIKIPEKLMPKRLQATSKVANLRGCARVCIGRNPYNGFKYLCAAVPPRHIALLQWYEPMEKFMFIKLIECELPSPLLIFEMFIFPNAEFPFICVGVFKARDGKNVKFHLININSKEGSSANTSSSTAGYGAADKAEQNTSDLKGLEELPVVYLAQLERDTVLVCYDRCVRMVTLQGLVKNSRRMLSELHFDFSIDSIVCLPDSVLAFSSHGVQGRHLKTSEVTQEIRDPSKLFHLLGSERVILVEARPTDDPMSNSNLYVLTGAQDTTSAGFNSST